jgi:4-hydroxy-tetrahydrodipicolinate reductase
MRIGIFGRGRLGSAIAQAAGSDVAWQLGREAPRPPGTLRPLSPVDVAIDASTSSAVSLHLDWAIAKGVNFVIGTTGWEIPDLAARVGSRIGVVVAPNFSLTVALLAKLARVVARYAATDPRFYLSLVEQHHALKADAPSGTARMLASVILEACPRKKAAVIPHSGRLDPTDLCVSSIRAGSSGANSHTFTIEAPEESLSVRHEGRTSAAYGAGALAACRWVAGKKGVLTMNDVARDVLDPLFREG